MSEDDSGVFTLSLDTELAWGCFDIGQTEKYREEYANTRRVVSHLCNLFEKYGVSATWAIVAHLLEDCGPNATTHNGQARPNFDWIDDWFEELPCSSNVDEELWYAPDLVQTIRSCSVTQELGLHGYTHMILGDDGCTTETAEDEVERAVAVFERSLGTTPNSFVFPRNQIGNLKVLREHGIETFRDRDARWYESDSVPNLVRSGCRFADEFVRASPPVVTPRQKCGMVSIPGSQIFRPNTGWWRYTPQNSQVARAKAGLSKAARTGKIFHLWFHPFNLGRDTDELLDALETILAHAAALEETGDIEILSMNEITEEYLRGRWT